MQISRLLLFVAFISLPICLRGNNYQQLSQSNLFEESGSIYQKVLELKKQPDFLLASQGYLTSLYAKADSKDLFYAQAYIGLELFLQDNLTESQKYLSNALLHANTIWKSSLMPGQLYFVMGKINAMLGRYSESSSDYDEAFGFFSDKNKIQFLGEIWNAKGELEYVKKEYNQAISFYNQALKLAKENNQSILEADVFLNKGRSFQRKGDYDHALSLINQAQEIYQKEESKSGICEALMLSGKVLYSLTDYEQALLMYDRGIELGEEVGLEKEIEDACLAIAEVYLAQNKTRDAIGYLNDYLRFKQLRHDTVGLINAQIGLGKYYFQIKNYDKASLLFHEAKNLLSNRLDVSLEGKMLLEMSKLYAAKEDPQQAKSYAQKALVIASTLDEKQMKADCYGVFSDLYEHLGDYRSSLFYKKKSSEINDSILNTNTLVALRNITVGEDSQERNRVIEELEQENLSLTQYWSKERSKGYILLVSTIFLFVFVLVLFLLFRAKNKAEKALKAKNIELEKLNATKDKFFSIIAHDLKSPFNSLLGFSEMLSLHAETRSYGDMMEQSKIIYNSTRKLYSLVDTLLQWSRTQLGTTEYRPDRMDVGIVTSNIVSILRINAEEKDIVISVDVDKGLLAWADKNLYSAVLRNLVSNAIKFSKVGSVIKVSASVNKQFIEISVSDSGVGITKENLQKIFNVDSNVSTKGTFNEKGTGLGLVLCKEFVEINKGTLRAESRLEKGSIFKFTIPLTGSFSKN
jgi:signal transduction histidine kinase